MNYKKLFGLGVLIWLIAYALAMGLFAYGVLGTLVANIIMIAAVAVAAYFAGTKLSAVSKGEVLKYSASWVVIGLLLDSALTVPYSGWALFYQWNIWASYALILLTPLLTVRKVPQCPK